MQGGEAIARVVRQLAHEGRQLARGPRPEHEVPMVGQAPGRNARPLPRPGLGTTTAQRRRSRRPCETKTGAQRPGEHVIDETTGRCTCLFCHAVNLPDRGQPAPTTRPVPFQTCPRFTPRKYVWCPRITPGNMYGVPGLPCGLPCGVPGLPWCPRITGGVPGLPENMYGVPGLPRDVKAVYGPVAIKIASDFKRRQIPIIVVIGK